MNVSELFDLTYWINSEIVVKKIQQKFNALFTVLNQNVQPNQTKTPLENQKNELLEVLANVPLHQLSMAQIDFLKNLGIGDNVGKMGSEKVEDVLYKNVIDIATSAKKIQEMQKEINQGVQKADQIKKGLEGCVSFEEYEENDEVLMRVSFTGNASMNNVTDFKKWGNTWYEIGRGIAIAHGHTPEDVRVIGATKGSIIIELAVIAGIAATVGKIILEALKVAEKVLEIKKKAEEIKNLKLNNSKLSKELLKEAENEKKIEVENITTAMVKELKINQDGQGDTVNALDKAIKDLVDFIESGGEVDFVIPEDGTTDDESKSRPDFNGLRITFTEIRQLESKIRLLEHIG